MAPFAFIVRFTTPRTIMCDSEPFYSIGELTYFIEDVVTENSSRFVKLHIGACSDHVSIVWLRNSEEVDELIALLQESKEFLIPQQLRLEQ